MKKYIILFLFIFMLQITNVSAKYDDIRNMMVIDDKIEVKSDTKYYFCCVSLYGVNSYIDILKESNIINPKLVVTTDSNTSSYNFIEMNVSNGCISYAEFVTDSNDNYIYYMSYPINDYLYKYHDYMFFLTENLDDYDKKTKYNYDNIDNYDGIYYVSNDDMKDINYILKSFEAFDLADGFITDKIEIVSNNYDINVDVGDYNLVLLVKDNNLNEETFNLLIRVVDITPPNIYTPKRIEANKNILLDYFDLIEYVSSDNIKNVRIIKNDYYKNYNIKGEYEVIFSVYDEFMNESYSKMIIGVNPDKDAKYEIKKYKEDNLSVNTIINNYFNDKNISASEIFIYKDNYSNNSNKKGLYDISLSYYDGNWHNDIINVDVIEKVDENPNDEKIKSNKGYLLLIIPFVGLIGILAFIAYKKKK